MCIGKYFRGRCIFLEVFKVQFELFKHLIGLFNLHNTSDALGRSGAIRRLYTCSGVSKKECISYIWLANEAW